MRRPSGAVAVLLGVTATLIVVGSAAASPPEIQIEHPDDGATVSGNLTINGTASDDETYATGVVENVSVRIDNGPWMEANDTSGVLADYDSWEVVWNSTWVEDGDHTITAQATDNDGETANDTVTVTVDNAQGGAGDRNETGDGEAPPADVNITVEARQSGCTGNRTWCLAVTEGNLSDLDPGLRVNATFVNPEGNVPHSLYLGNHSRADPDHEETPTSAAFARIEATAGGASSSTNFTVPAGADAIYVWCDEAQHEGQGMYLHGPDATHGDGTDGAGNETGDDEDTGAQGPPSDGNGLPGPGAAATAAGAVVAAVLSRRRGTEQA